MRFSQSVIALVFLFALMFSFTAAAQSFSKLKKQAIEAYEMQDFETAKKVGMQALDIRPKDVQTNILVGDAEYFLKNYESALSHYQKVFAKVNHPDMFLRTGTAMLAVGKDEEAIVYYRMVSKLKPYDSMIRRLISKIYFDRGDYTTALWEIDFAEKLEPLSSPTIFGKAQILLKMNRIEESCIYLNKPQLTETPEVKILREINCSKTN